MAPTRARYNTQQHREYVKRRDVNAKRREIRAAWTHPERRSVKNPVATLGAAILAHTRGTTLKAQKAYLAVVDARAEAEIANRKLRETLCDFHSRLNDLWEDGQWVLGTGMNGGLPLESIATELRQNPERLQVSLFAGLDEDLVRFATASGPVACPLCGGKGRWEKTA